MPEWLQNTVATASEVAWLIFLMRLLLAFLLGGCVAAIYRFTQRPGIPAAPSFIATLVLLCILIAMATQVIGGNVARAFSLVGALSIIRFRTVVEDTRDTAFVIFAVVLGMAVGAGEGNSFTEDNLITALIGLIVVGLAAFVLRWLPASRTDNEWSLQLRFGAGINADADLQAIFARYCTQSALISTVSARQGAAFDFTYKLLLKPSSTPAQLLADINRLEGIQNVEFRRVTAM